MIQNSLVTLKAGGGERGGEGGGVSVWVCNRSVRREVGVDGEYVSRCGCGRGGGGGGGAIASQCGYV